MTLTIRKATSLYSFFLPIILLLSLVCIMFAGCKQDKLDIIKHNDSINIGILSPFPPFSFINEEGVPDGLSALLAKRIAKDLLGSEDKATFIMLSPDEGVNALIDNRVDIIVGMVCVNTDLRDEKSKKIQCAKEYLHTYISIVGKVGNDFFPFDFKMTNNAPLILQKGSTIESYFNKHYPNLSYIYCANTEECFSLLAEHNESNLVQYDIVALHFIRQNPQFRTTIYRLGAQHIIAPAIKKDNPKLLEWLNKEIDTLKNEGFFAIYKEELN